MNKYKGCFRGYYRDSKSVYSLNTIQVTFGMYHPQSKRGNEMVMKWVDLEGKYVAKLECFEDAFTMLKLFSDVVEKLSETNLITEEEFCELLEDCGFEDLTKYN